MSPSKLQAFYNAIDVFVNPTLRPQGLDLTLMEAMMSGKPVMASRFRSILKEALSSTMSSGSCLLPTSRRCWRLWSWL
ncbi:hypothetical protein ACLB2K_026683 [Fragaria x ananassa]